MQRMTALAFSSILHLAPALAEAQVSAAPAATAAPVSTTGPSTASAPVAPASTAPESVTVKAPAGVNLDEVVCKQTPAKTGSRLGGARECQTVRVWNQRQLDSQNALIRQQQMGNIQMGRGG